MPDRILRVDLGRESRDFIGVSLNDMPVIDKSKSNDAKLRKALGRLAAQPEYDKNQPDVVNFFACDESGGQPHDVQCETITERELRTNNDLKADLEMLEQRLAQVEPEELRTTLVRNFETIRNSGPAHQACHFCKWKTPGGTWHLVWLWGFQRRDLEPAPPVICCSKNCKALFAKRADNPYCPSCDGPGLPPPNGGLPSWLKAILTVAAVLIVGLIAFGAYKYGSQQSEEIVVDPQPPADPQLVVTPAEWTGPVGGRIQFKVARDSEDVTGRVAARSDSPRVARFKRAQSVALARSPGRSVVSFHLGDLVAKATVNVQPPSNPKTLSIEPKTLTLGVGATSQLRVIGEYESGGKVDLTEAAIWAPSGSQSVFVHRGSLQGKSGGTASVRAMYRASADQQWLDTTAEVTVKDEDYESLSISVDRETLSAGQACGIAVQAVAKSGEEYSVAGSSELELNVVPAHVARIEDGLLYAVQPGQARLVAAFSGLTAEREFTVEGGETEVPFEVIPGTLEIAVGEAAKLEVASSSDAPVHYVSSTPKVVEVTSDGRIIGRKPGKNASVLVTQGENQAEVVVDVTRELLESVAIVPEQLSVSVDEAMPVRLVGRTASGVEMDLAADRIRAERLPSPEFVSFDPTSMQLRGVKTTQGSPQKLSLRVGDLKATATIDVVSAPMQLSISPASPIDLPVGQTAPLQVWADYGSGRRVEVMPDRVDWQISPDSPSGFSFDRKSGIARASSPGVGPVEIIARYQGENSGRLIVRTIEARPTTLEIAGDRNPLAVGEHGQFRAVFVDTDGTRTPADGAEFASVDKTRLVVDQRTGAYAVMAPGSVTVVARHSAAGLAKKTFEIVARDTGRLVLKPANVRLPVGGRLDLGLFLVTDGGEREIPLVGNDRVKLAGLKRDVAGWEAPTLVGRKPTARPFEFAATWQGKTAKTLVEVLPNDRSAGPAEIRIEPGNVTLAAGQPYSPAVHERVPGGNEWVELQPELVRWKYPADHVAWTPAGGMLRPSFELTEASPDAVEVSATYGDATAKLVVTRKPADSLPDPADENSELTVAREPQGESLPVGQRQRYTILIHSGDTSVPAVQVEWPAAFENEFVAWHPPVLTARKAGHTQRLTAKVGDRSIDVVTQIIDAPPEPTAEPPVNDERPQLVRISSGQGSKVQIGVNSDFTEFTIEAQFASGAVRDVTRDAQLVVEEDSQDSAVALSTGRISGLRPGGAVVHAEFQGVRTTNGLAVEVTGAGAVTSLKIDPEDLELAVGENVRIRAIGYTGDPEDGVPVGDVSTAAGFTWQTQPEGIVSVAGGTLHALQPGTATLIGKFGDAMIAGRLTVKEDIAELDEKQIVVAPESLVLRVGESKSIGGDITVSRGGADLSERTNVSSSQPGTVRFDDASRSVVGVSPGEAKLAFTYLGSRQVIPVTVEPASKPAGKVEVLIEPSSGILAVGETRSVRVFLRDGNGTRTDRTSSALIESSDEKVLSVVGTEVVGVEGGSAKLFAALPESDEAGSADFTVQDEQYTKLEVTPPNLRLATGEGAKLRVHAIGPGGRRDITGHRGLTIGVAADVEAVAVNGSAVRAIVAGEAQVDVTLGTLSEQVAVTVVDEPWHDLRIEPLEATIKVGEETSFLVYAKRGDKEKSLTRDDGVEVRLSNTSAARLDEPFTVAGVSPGFTTVNVRLGKLQAEANVTVNASDRPDPPAEPPGLPPGLRFIPDVLTLQIGTPGASVRVVKIGPDGSEEDVDHETEMTFVGAEGVAELRWTGSGAVFKPLKLGSTRVAATYKGVPTSRPLLVRVVDHPEDLQLEVRPNPVALRVGESTAFNRARITSNRSDPVDVDYEVTTNDPAIVAVENGRLLKGIAAGETTVVIAPIGVDEQRFRNLRTTIAVRVEGTPDEDDSQFDLVLSGPAETTVGATAEFTIELVGENGKKDVTSEGASLVVDRDQVAKLELSPGGKVVAKKPGTVNVRARYKDLISAPVSLTIAPLASRFVKLEVEIDSRPMAVNESRPYKLWGYPEGGEGRQDLTNSIAKGGSAGPRVALRPSAGIAEHESPNVVGLAPGSFKMGAIVGEGETAVQSPVVSLDVVDDADDSPGTLTAEPAAISVHVGQPAPPVRILARRPGESTPRQIDVPLTSEAPEILAPGTDGGFVGQGVGMTRLIAKSGDQEVAISVKVTGDPFESVEVALKPGNPFNVLIDVVGVMADDTEYRVLGPTESDVGDWQKATRDGNRLTIQLAGPPIAWVDVDTVYRLLLEARSGSDPQRARYPCDFSIKWDVKEESRDP